MSKPVMLYNYEYTMAPWESRKADSFTFQLEDALSEFFTVVHRGDARPPDVDVVLNTVPLSRVGSNDKSDLFLSGQKTYFWNPIPLEGMFEELVDRCDKMFCNVPSMTTKYGDKGVTLLSAVNPNYQYHQSEFEYDIGFLGSEIEMDRIFFLDQLDREFKLLRGAASGLGKPSAELLSKCKLVLSIEDYYDRFAGIEHRLWTFGNVRPILVRWNPDYDIVGKDKEHYIGYTNEGDAIDKIHYYLEHMNEAEKIFKNLKAEFDAKHQWKHRAEQVYKVFMEG